MVELTFAEVEAAAARIAGRVRPVPVARPVPSTSPGPGVSPVAGTHPDPGAGPAGDAQVFFALEFMQFTGTFKARGAKNFIRAHLESGSLPPAGVAIASGGNAGLACAWAAGEEGVPATVFLPENAPAVKVERLRGYGADVRLIGTEYAEAAAACAEFVRTSGALASHAYDHPLIAAGAGTLLMEVLAEVPDLDTVVVAVGGGGLFAGVAAVAAHHGVRTVAVEPENCRALNAALEAGRVVDVPVDSVAADSLGARRVSELALRAAESDLVTSVLVSDAEIVETRRALWAEHRLVVEHAAATALAGIGSPGGYRPRQGEKVCVVLCGANTSLGDL